MSYDETLASRVRWVLANRSDIDEKAMFGGLAFMLGGHMCCGLVQSKLMVRVDPNAYDRLLREPHAKDFTGRPMRGFLYVDLAGLASLPALEKWIARAVQYAEGKPEVACFREGGAWSVEKAASPPRLKPMTPGRSGRSMDH